VGERVVKLLFVHSDEVDARQNLLKIRALVRMQINRTASRHSGNPHTVERCLSIQLPTLIIHYVQIWRVQRV